MCNMTKRYGSLGCTENVFCGYSIGSFRKRQLHEGDREAERRRHMDVSATGKQRSLHQRRGIEGLEFLYFTSLLGRSFANSTRYWVSPAGSAMPNTWPKGRSSRGWVIFTLPESVVSRAAMSS